MPLTAAELHTLADQPHILQLSSIRPCRLVLQLGLAVYPSKHWWRDDIDLLLMDNTFLGCLSPPPKLR